QAPTWEKDRLQGIRVLLRAIADGNANAPEQILARWTWKLARASRKAQDRRASAEFPDAKRLLGALANSRGHRHEENAATVASAPTWSRSPAVVRRPAPAAAQSAPGTEPPCARSERRGASPATAVPLRSTRRPPTLRPSRRRRRKRKRKGRQQ